MEFENGFGGPENVKEGFNEVNHKDNTETLDEKQLELLKDINDKNKLNKKDVLRGTNAGGTIFAEAVERKNSAS